MRKRILVVFLALVLGFSLANGLWANPGKSEDAASFTTY